MQLQLTSVIFTLRVQHQASHIRHVKKLNILGFVASRSGRTHSLDEEHKEVAFLLFPSPFSFFFTTYVQLPLDSNGDADPQTLLSYHVSLGCLR